ncbi:MAG: Orotate phosphoribosyltransferase [Parcubacteria bacterium C7867-003]|nr:MAG: Orotate phosphoribosyltransferase [Parcubacteria bacterium C7867-003]
MNFDTEGWIGKYQQKDALWIHDGNPLRPHALLTSGLHSNGFFNSRLVIPDEDLLAQAAEDLVDLLLSAGLMSHVGVVVGPQTGATKLADLIANVITRRRGWRCYSASPAKGEVDSKKVMQFSDDECMMIHGRYCLLCEDVLTTGGSVSLTARAVANCNGMVLPQVGVLVNRSGTEHVDGAKIVALISRDMPTWQPEECPLCAQGSEAIRPKGENWARLNAKY